MRWEALHPCTALFISHCLVLDQTPGAIHPSRCSGKGAELGLVAAPTAGPCWGQSPVGWGQSPPLPDHPCTPSPSRGRWARAGAVPGRAGPAPETGELQPEAALQNLSIFFPSVPYLKYLPAGLLLLQAGFARCQALGILL